MKINKDIERRIEEKERKEQQVPTLEAEAKALQVKFEIVGLTLGDLEAIQTRSREGEDMQPHPLIYSDENGDYRHYGYSFRRADKKEYVDERTLLQKLRGITNGTSIYTNLTYGFVEFGPWQRRAYFCGDGISLQILCDERGIEGKRNNGGKEFERTVPYGDTLDRNTPKDELLRLCLEFAWQRYTENPKIKVELKQEK